MRQSKQRQSNQPLKALEAVIRNCRLDRLMTQQQLSDGAHLHRTYITDVENGLRNISYLTLQRISFALNFKMSQLILNAEIILVHDEV